ncbi:hypothetical protein BDN72DRAFT_863744 [Pluteus cervinus]|uniref:Uncharacterized protein n=1 Tax=Pluteus cervinus TaxID=181527 RepID=A0ACD3A5Y7_9AGAR|nr:hypothetical protein BDN72DRAFT_863744 [Pluteus cervinus]
MSLSLGVNERVVDRCGQVAGITYHRGVPLNQRGLETEVLLEDLAGPQRQEQTTVSSQIIAATRREYPNGGLDDRPQPVCLIEGPASTIVVQVLVSRPLKLDLVDAECNLSIDAIFDHQYDNSFLLKFLLIDSLSERLSAFVLSQSVIQEMETAQSGVNFISELPGHVEKLQGQANSLRGQFGKIIQELQKRQFCHRRLPEVSKKMKESEQLFQRVQGLVAFEQIKRPIKDVFECMESILETMEPLIKMDVLGQIAGFNKEKNLFELSINLKIFQEELGIVIRSLTQRKEKMIADMFKFSEEISPTSHE